MAVSTRKVAETFLDIEAGVGINCNWPLKDDDEVVCIYGKASLKAVKNTDYAVTLAPPNYDTFIIMPLQSWIDKINALIAADATETNYTTIRRKTDTLSSVSNSNAHDVDFLRREVERIWLNLQELDEQISGAATLEPRYIGDVNGPITVGMPEAGKALIGNDDETGYIAGPSVDDLEAAEANAEIATAKAAEAAASAASIGLTSTSSSTVTVGSGSKAFTVTAGKSWITGQRLRVATADATKIMEGPVASYVGTTLTLNVDYTVGAGSASSWNIGVSGERGATGATGATGPAGPGSGDMLKSENLSGLGNYATARSNLGLTIGTDVQAYSAILASIVAAGGASSSNFLRGDLTWAGAGLITPMAVRSPGAVEEDTQTGIPTGVKRVTIKFNSLVKGSGNSDVGIRLGTSAGIVTAGYAGWGSRNGATTANNASIFPNVSWTAGGNYGIITLDLIDASTNTWAWSGSLGNGGGYICVVAGTITLPGALDRIQVCSIGGTVAGTFSSGSWQVSYQ